MSSKTHVGLNVMCVFAANFVLFHLLKGGHINVIEAGICGLAAVIAAVLNVRWYDEVRTELDLKFERLMIESAQTFADADNDLTHEGWKHRRNEREEIQKKYSPKHPYFKPNMAYVALAALYLVVAALNVMQRY